MDETAATSFLVLYIFYLCPYNYRYTMLCYTMLCYATVWTLLCIVDIDVKGRE